MALLTAQFEQACSNVEPETQDKDNAIAAHTAVRDVLDSSSELVEIGIDTILIGSYKRSVSIRRVKDVDVFSRTDQLDMSGGEALDLFERVLSEPGAFGVNASRQDRSIKIEFPDYDLHVDAVPARPSGDYWEIPDPEGGWVETNPEGLTELSSAMNKEYEGKYVPIVKLIRQTRRANLGDHPGGLFFEILAYHAFAGGLSGTNLGELYVQALRSVADQLAAVVAGGSVHDPTMEDATISVRAEAHEMESAATTFDTLAKKAQEAIEADKCPAALAFREILRKNSDDEWVFPMPDTCNADGTEKSFASVRTPGDRQVPAGNSRFA